jgi:signal transduction histidine kinase/CheY-like chemotaxis protein
MIASLSTFPASRRQRVFAFAVLALLGAFVVAMLPIAHVPLLPIVPFLPTFTTFVAVADLLTAFLIYRDAANAHSISLGVLASGYLYAGLIVIPHVLAFPGVYTTRGLLGSGPVAAWLWVAWHAGFPAFALGFAFLERWPPRWGEDRERLVRFAIPLGAVGFAVGVVLLVTLRRGSFPALLHGSDNSPFWTTGVAPALIAFAALSLLAVIVLAGTRTVAPLWLAVASGAMLLDIVLSLLSGGRYSVGWYLARGIALVAAAVVLLALLRETGLLLESVTRAERRLRTIVDGVGDALLGLDDFGRIVDANPAAVQLFDLPEEALRMRAATDVLQQSPVPLELSIGENVVIARDVTERRRAEEASREAVANATEAAAVKSRFLATMSHEIRTPINAVLGMSELLLQMPLTDEARDYAQTVHESAEALLTVLNEILDYSKIEAGATELEQVAYSPLVIVETAADILATTARKKRLALATFVAPDVPRSALGDPHRVRQILLNLVGNAVKFTTEGSVIVRATVTGNADDRVALVRFEVSDTGPGIAPDAAARLFEPFRQADVRTARRYGGTGLGLSISKRLVELMNGTIGFDSVPGAGTTFWFVLPLERAPADVDGVDGRPELRGARILVIDGEHGTRSVVERYLFAWGAVVLGVADLAQAIELARAGVARGADVDAILLAEDGDPAARLAQLRRESGTVARALLIASGDRAGQAERAIAAGYNGYLRKPLRQSLLLDAVADMLAGIAPRSEPIDSPVAVATEDLAILVADDNLVNRKLTLQQLKKLGHHADAVEDGRAAVEAVARRQYDVVLMDCEMPELDGFAATREIRAAERLQGGHLTIVAMTAHALDGDREACLAAGMDDYLPKPVQLEALRGALERLAHEPGARSARVK